MRFWQPIVHTVFEKPHFYGNLAQKKTLHDDSKSLDAILITTARVFSYVRKKKTDVLCISQCCSISYHRSAG